MVHGVRTLFCKKQLKQYKAAYRRQRREYVSLWRIFYLVQLNGLGLEFKTSDVNWLNYNHLMQIYPDLRFCALQRLLSSENKPKRELDKTLQDAAYRAAYTQYLACTRCGRCSPVRRAVPADVGTAARCTSSCGRTRRPRRLWRRPGRRLHCRLWWATSRTLLQASEHHQRRTSRRTARNRRRTTDCRHLPVYTASILLGGITSCSASESADACTFLRSAICPSVVCLLHSYHLLKPFDEFRRQLTDLLKGWPSANGYTVVTCNQPPRSTQPGHPSKVGAINIIIYQQISILLLLIVLNVILIKMILPIFLLFNSVLYALSFFWCVLPVFVTQNWVSILSNVSWKHTFLQNIDDKMY